MKTDFEDSNKFQLFCAECFSPLYITLNIHDILQKSVILEIKFFWKKFLSKVFFLLKICFKYEILYHILLILIMHDSFKRDLKS